MAQYYAATIVETKTLRIVVKAENEKEAEQRLLALNEIGKAYKGIETLSNDLKGINALHKEEVEKGAAYVPIVGGKNTSKSVFTFQGITTKL